MLPRNIFGQDFFFEIMIRKNIINNVKYPKTKFEDSRIGVVDKLKGKNIFPKYNKYAAKSLCIDWNIEKSDI